MNILATILVGIVAFVGSFLPLADIWDKSNLNLGATNFPASLDSLTNPVGTDSVATVSHSGQHSNANDAIEAVEAKLGVTASTPATDTLLAGNSSGSSIWTTFATGTRATFTNFLATGSTTLQSFTAVTSTTSSATTTNHFATTASSSNLFSANISGAGLSTCTGSNFLQWSGGTFTCTATVGASLQSVSTTSVANMATTTLRGIPFGKVMRVTFMTASTSQQQIRMCFNEDWGGCSGGTSARYDFSNSIDGVVGTQATDQSFIRLENGGTGVRSTKMSYSFTIHNGSTTPKLGTGIGITASSTNNTPLTTTSGFFWGSTTPSINSITFSVGDTANSNSLQAGSYIQVDVVAN